MKAQGGDAPGRGIVALLFAMFGGPVAYAVHLMVGFPLAASCERALVAVLYVLTLGLGAVALAAAVVAYRALPPPQPPRTRSALLRERRAFMATAGLLLSLLSLALIVLETVPALVLSGCG